MKVAYLSTSGASAEAGILFENTANLKEDPRLSGDEVYLQVLYFF